MSNKDFFRPLYVHLPVHVPEPCYRGLGSITTDSHTPARLSPKLPHAISLLTCPSTLFPEQKKNPEEEGEDKHLK